MNTVVVWFMVTITYGPGLLWSPPFPSQEACIEAQKQAEELARNRLRCIKATVVKP